MIEVLDINKSFEGKKILHDISANFYDGKVNQIIGPSGSGKTVLMKCVIGLHIAEDGQILYDGRDILNMRKDEIKKLRREVGMLFQGSALFDSLTVIENVLFPLEMFSSMTKIEKEKRAIFCLERVNLLEDKHKLYPSEISGGMQKRVAIARAIALNPKYLFCDEPNSGLDPVTSLVIDKLIKEITQEYDITTIVNTHDMNSIMETGDHIILIRDGHKTWEGSKDDIFKSDNESLQDFVFASQLFKTIKTVHNNN
ncbi:MAG: ATP-binding cassette domain-containing protein [Paludibacteraceae bacterium]|nr:ATP-binding cassette domain-containing protein [Paludibacteraceae bacterium]